MCARKRLVALATAVKTRLLGNASDLEGQGLEQLSTPAVNNSRRGAPEKPEAVAKVAVARRFTFVITFVIVAHVPIEAQRFTSNHGGEHMRGVMYG